MENQKITDAQLNLLQRLTEERLEPENQIFFWRELFNTYKLKSKFEIPKHVASQLINSLIRKAPIDGQRRENPSEFDDYDIVGCKDDEFTFRDGDKEPV